MIPIRLTFEAFGPFARQQSIDFTAFDSERIFLVSGMTGSGKTTIFDAICFSLYGTASGALRESESFKSDFADEKTICFAEFEFLIHGQRYTVRREPIQFRLKRNGNLVKDSNSSALLTLENGESVSGPLNVTARIEGLLGINADQFKKIVMLPQGEFRKFLSDDSNEKQKILRKIFSTEILEAFTERLRLNAQSVKSELEQYATRSAAHIEGILCETDSELYAAAHADIPDVPHVLELLKESNRELRNQVVQRQKRLDNLNQQKAEINLPYAREINGKFELLAASQAALAELEEQQPLYEALEQRISRLKSIREIVAYETVAAQNDSEQTVLRERQKQVQAALEKEQTEFSAAAADLETAKAAQARIPELAQEMEQWKARAESLRMLSQTVQERAELEGEAEKRRKASERLRRQRCCAVLREEITEKTAELERWTTLQKEILYCGELSRIFQEANSQYQSGMNLFLDSQAFLLAGGLRNDTPCPVCGSTTHPSPAQSPGRTITKEEVECCKDRYEDASRALKEQQGLCRQLLLGADCDIKAHGRLSEFLPEIAAALSEAASMLKQRKAELCEIPGWDAPIPGLPELNRQLAEQDTQVAVTTEKLLAAETRITALREKIQDTALTAEQATQKIAFLQRQISDCGKAADAAAQRCGQLAAACERDAEAVRQLAERSASLQETLTQNRRRFQEQFSTLGLSTTEYEAYKKDAGQLGKYEEDLASYRDTLTQKRSLIDSLAPQLLDLSPVNLNALQEKQEAIQLEIDQETRRFTTDSGRLQSNRERYGRLRDICREAETLSVSYGAIQKLYDVASGKYSDKINFERYVLASYFNDVIDNANLRLEQMTNSRYTLNRRRDREKGNKSSGLSLEVFDAYTGKARHVNTLSGGESFKIALALALGLADIISQNSGGIELNTMFIDEGFGSLDQNSLESAIECLNNLRSSGRYIGIISHVSELKEKIPAKINVIQEPQGSSIQVLA